MTLVRFVKEVISSEASRRRLRASGFKLSPFYERHLSVQHVEPEISIVTPQGDREHYVHVRRYFVTTACAFTTGVVVGAIVFFLGIVSGMS